jgi:hypothetical protein
MIYDAVCSSIRGNSHAYLQGIYTVQNEDQTVVHNFSDAMYVLVIDTEDINGLHHYCYSMLNGEDLLQLYNSHQQPHSKLFTATNFILKDNTISYTSSVIVVQLGHLPDEMTVNLDEYSNSFWQFLKIANRSKCVLHCLEKNVNLTQLRFSDSTPNVVYPEFINGSYRTQVLYNCTSQGKASSTNKETPNLIEIPETSKDLMLNSFGKQLTPVSVKPYDNENTVYSFDPYSFQQGILGSEEFELLCGFPEILYPFDQREISKSYLNGIDLAETVLRYIYKVCQPIPVETETHEFKPHEYPCNIAFISNFSKSHIRVLKSQVPDYIKNYKNCLENKQGSSYEFRKWFLDFYGTSLLNIALLAGFSKVFVKSELGYDAHSLILARKAILDRKFECSLDIFKWKASMFLYRIFPANYEQKQYLSIGELSMRVEGFE